MKIIFSGDNDFEIEMQVDLIASKFTGEIYKYDESNLNKNIFSDIKNQNIFFKNKLLIVKDLSSRLVDVEKFIEVASKSEESIVLINPEVDKRTKLYKDLTKYFTVTTIDKWSYKNLIEAIKWTNLQLDKFELKIKKELVEELIKRSDFDQRIIISNIEKMSLNGKDIDNLDEFIGPSISENVFNIFESILSGNKQMIKQKVENLRLSEDPFKLFGLLTGQLIAILAIKNSNKKDFEIAKDLNLSPYMISKLTVISNNISNHKLKLYLENFTQADIEIKNSNNNPWDVLSSLLYRLAL